MQNLLLKDQIIQAEVPVAFLRYLETRTEERVLEAVLVYSGLDRWDTIIDPEGMSTDPSIVTIDYNHKGVDTGAYLKNTRVVKNYELSDGTVLEKALIGNIHIPKDAEMFYHDKDGAKRSNGNLYEAVTKGQVKSVSVEFKPYLDKTEEVILENGKTIVRYKKWDLLRLSVLDVTPGQPYSGIKIIRMSNQENINNNTVAPEEIETKATAVDVEESKEETINPEEESLEREISLEIESEEENPDKETPKEEEEPTEDTRASEIEELRSVITKLEERIAMLESYNKDRNEKRSEEEQPESKDEQPSEEEAEEAEAEQVRNLKPQVDDLPEKVEENLGSAVRQLANDSDVISFTVDDMKKEIAKSKLNLL